MNRQAIVAEHTRPEHRQQDWILGMNDVVEMTGVSRATLYVWMTQGIFPQASKIGLRRIGWRASQIDRWMEQRFGPGEAPATRLAAPADASVPAFAAAAPGRRRSANGKRNCI